MRAISIPAEFQGDIRETYDHRSLCKKVADAVLSLFRQLHYGFWFVTHRCISLCSRSSRTRNIQWEEGQKGLAVFLHGLHGDPVAWNAQLNLLKEYPEICIYTPVVHRRGICPLEEAIQPLFASLRPFAQGHPGIPICLFGVSNGSRIATWLECQLRTIAPATPLRISTIAGIHRGSSGLKLLNLPLVRWFYPKKLREELAYDSSYALSLLKEVKSPPPEGCRRSFEFFASTEDFTVPDLNSSLPELPADHPCFRYLIHGEGHDSIVSCVAPLQIGNAIAWMKANFH